MRVTALAAAAFALAGIHTTTTAQPSGATVVHGTANVQQVGSTTLVTTTNGAGTRHSAIDWRSFSVPQGTVTRFVQPGADSTSINRVTGSKPSEILGTLASNGRLVLVNPAGIAVGAGGVVDTAGFTASTLGMADADMRAGRLRFTAAGKDKGTLDIQGRVIARSGDVVLLGTDVKVDKDALVQAPGNTVILAAGQTIEITGRGLEGIFLEVTAKNDRVVNLGTLEGDAVGLFASQLRHSGVIRANTVRMEDEKVRLERDKGKPDDRDDKPGNGNSGHGNSGNGNAGNGNAGNNGNGNPGNGNGGSEAATGTGENSSVGSNAGNGGTAGDTGNAGGAGTAPGTNTGANTAPNTGNDAGTNPTPGSGTSPTDHGTVAAPSTAPAPASAPAASPAPAAPQEAAVQTMRQQAVYTGPAVTPGDALNIGREQDRFAGVAGSTTEVEANADPRASDTSILGGPDNICRP